MSCKYFSANFSRLHFARPPIYRTTCSTSNPQLLSHICVPPHPFPFALNLTVSTILHPLLVPNASLPIVQTPFPSHPTDTIWPFSYSPKHPLQQHLSRWGLVYFWSLVSGTTPGLYVIKKYWLMWQHACRSK